LLQPLGAITGEREVRCHRRAGEAKMREIYVPLPSLLDNGVLRRGPGDQSGEPLAVTPSGVSDRIDLETFAATMRCGLSSRAKSI
jgi:hypothetical protein